MTAANIYPSAIAQAFLGNIKWTTDTIKMGLVGSGYTPNLGTDEYWSTPQTYEISGTGYTAGGLTLSSTTLEVTAANSWPLTWGANTVYPAGFTVVPVIANSYVYRTVLGGTSGPFTPSWPTVPGMSFNDGSVLWFCAGESVTVWSSALADWSSADITNALYGVIYDAESGSASTDPLIALINFITPQSSEVGYPFIVVPDANLGWYSTTPA